MLHPYPAKPSWPNIFFSFFFFIWQRNMLRHAMVPMQPYDDYISSGPSHDDILLNPHSNSYASADLINWSLYSRFCCTSSGPKILLSSLESIRLFLAWSLCNQISLHIFWALEIDSLSDRIDTLLARSLCRESCHCISSGPFAAS